MSTYDDDAPKRTIFDVRSVNLTKIFMPIDLEILVDECNFAIAGIRRQIEDKFGGPNWLTDAKRAIGEIEHKRDLVKRKLAAVTAPKKPPESTNAEGNFNKRFVSTARELLPPDLYAVVFDGACKKGQGAPA